LEEVIAELPYKFMAQDYFMRMLEESSRMLEAVLIQRKAGRNYDAVHELERACELRIGLPLSVVKGSSPEALSELMQRSGDRYTLSVLLAELLLQDAELNKLAGRSADAIRSQLQAFCLLGESIDVLSPVDQAAYRPKLEALAHELGAISNDPYLEEKLRKYSIPRKV